ncbi:phosphate ABC transporter substrate-binding protein PstS [Methermicoccus shengliensis]|uniref:Phosphate-binding protein n=1 Tax=Methermicoccus shengliensis TaxID=660064 RepID=A0A832VWX1_9EURY|nr:phosphate ABC transporter substrate-binding protein PstS [Methermicoccus shengliensis]KUK05070.1 MAG: Phosphate ABC transporter substrate-binding protein, PhoT family [Euryarchaeota archaeon 55_53]KUK30363.1 MAG: Phosphate ABC transporter substrate-binding protein, PhoT family [Methanosarcinales archeaon 56_1174]MDI3487546.1 phosphate transport system substrate-binding protein [Methanosarcinales archaeon]MDN5294695.1 phosphate transport system substrate-binding protein [Methanosarcinales arc
MKSIYLLAAVAVMLSSVALGCMAPQNGTQPEQATSVAHQTTLYGSGATFPQPQIEKWIGVYTSGKNVRIEYTGKGSGGGQNDFKQGLVDFAASDPPLKESLWNELRSKGQPLQFPVIVGAVVVAYNVPGVNELKLDGKTVADIFMGKVEYWDDPAIKALNPGVDLPHEKIIVAHRSDSSGTTNIFTTYLSMVNEEWNDTVGTGKMVSWPVDKAGRGFGGKGNQGVATIIKQSDYSIGYVELAYALKEKFPVVALKNRDGYYVKASPETIQCAISRVGINIPSPYEGYKENMAAFMNAAGKDSYPIVAFSHMVIWEHYDDRAKEEAMKNFVKWVLTSGQKSEYIVDGYVGLPGDVSQKLLKEMGLL